MVTAIYIGTEKLDLFKDDNIIIKNSVSKIEDITKVFTDTSNSFHVPASDRNNKIFKHYYNASIKNPFDARKLVLGAIYLDGLHYKSGNFKLNSVKVKSQKADSYSLDFFGLLTQLKDLIGADKLTALDLSAYDYAYNYENVRDKLTGEGSNDVVNTLLSNKRYIYDTNANTENTDEIRNLADNNTSNTSGIVYQDSYNSLRSHRIIEAIEAKYNITFSRDFFGTTDFTFLYLLLNGGSNTLDFSQQVVFNYSTDDTLENDRVLLSTDLNFNDTTKLNIQIYTTNNNRPNFTSIVKSNGVEIHRFNSNSVFTSNGIYQYSVNKADYNDFENLTFEITSLVKIPYRYTVERVRPTGSNVLSTRNLANIDSYFKVSERMPDIKIIDFLKGIFQMFKLVVIPISENELFVDTSENYYKSTQAKDVTGFVDFTETNISAGKLLNEINYKFQEAQTILAKQFKTNTGADYGNLELIITDENGKAIEGDSIEIELPFENMVYEKLNDLNGEQVSEVVYGLMTDDSLNAVTVKPHFHYIITKDLNFNLKILDDSGERQVISSLSMPTHVRATNSTVFGEEINEHNGIIISDTLYSNFHKAFIQASFNAKKRQYSYSLKNVSLDLIRNLKLNDNIIIKGRAYRIDSLDTNITTKEINLNLINL